MMFDITKIKHLGKDATIGEFVKIVNPEKVEVGDFSRIDDFTLIVGGEGVKIGKCVHISSYCSVAGSGEFIMEDFSGLSAGCRIITGSDDYSGKCMTNPCVPKEFRPFAYRSKIHIKMHAIIGTNTVIHPGITIGEGAATGSGTIVTKDLEPWSIYIGAPAKKIKDRMKDEILRMEKELAAKYF